MSDAQNPQFSMAAGLELGLPPVVPPLIELPKIELPKVEIPKVETKVEINAEAHADTPADEPEREVVPPTMAAQPLRDPGETIAASMLWIGLIYRDIKKVIPAVNKHLVTVSAEPELHAFLQRINVQFGETVHLIDQLEQGMSDQLRDSITAGVAA